MSVGFDWVDGDFALVFCGFSSGSFGFVGSMFAFGKGEARLGGHGNETSEKARNGVREGEPREGDSGDSRSFKAHGP